MSSVSLVHCTPNAEELIVDMARVSNPANQAAKLDGNKLLKYLIKHKHWSPFEMASMCVRIECTRAISPQLLRHRSFSFQEYSQRYAVVPDIPEIPAFRRQDNKNRQNSHDDLNEFFLQELQLKTIVLFQQAASLYKYMLEAGVAKECARSILPLASPSVLYMHGNIRSWIHYCELRCDSSTQLEHRTIANDIKQLMYDQFPTITQAAFQ
jgi:thymidylate synthase (FAD)